LCEGDHVGTEAGMLMQTDSEKLLEAGVETGAMTFADLLTDTQWSASDVTRSICHQVGGTHRKQMLESLGLKVENDFATFPWLGNTGSAALPSAMALANEEGFLRAGDRVAMLGIGSGINSLMIAVEWGGSI
jgi:3-oxoacyl-[acyl-carrier-protein] synthase III